MNMLECSWGATEALSAESITFVAQLHGLLTQANLLLGGTTDPTTTTTSTAPTTPRSRARAAVRPWLESTAKTVALAQTPVKTTAPTTPLTTATTPTTTATTTNATLQQQHVSAAAGAGQSPGCSPTSPNRDAINRAGSLSSVVTLEHTPLLAESNNNNAPREGRGVGRPSHLHHLFSRGGTLVDLVRVMGQLLARNVANEVGGARITPVVCGILKLCQVHCVAVVEASLWLLFQEAYHNNNNNNNVPRTSSPAFDDDAGRWKRMETIADDVRLALAALRECGIVAADGLSPTDATSVRMAMEWAVFTLRKLRAAMARFELQIIHEERRRMHRASSNACGGDEWQTRHDPRVLAHLRTRVDELRRQVWGPSVCRALSHHVQQLMIAAVGQVVRVIDLGGVSAAGSSSPTPAGASASSSSSSSSSSLADLARDASTALFRLCDPVRAVSGGTAESSISSGPLFSSPPSARQVPPSSSSSPHHPHEVAKAHDDDDDDAQPQHSEADHSGSSAGGVGGGAAMVQQSSSGAMFPRVEIHTAMAVLPTLGISFMASYFAAIAQNAGEGSSGKLVATRILSDMLHDSCTNSNNNNNNTLATSTTPIVWSVSGVLCFAVRESQWSHPLFGGLLSCVTSSLPVVLSAGLSALRAVVLECGTDLPAEVGLMYRSCLFPMLESDNSPAYVKMEVMVHLLTTFLRRGGGDGHHHHREKDGEDGVGERTSSFMLPQLLRFYLAYDLNLAAPHLNVVQHLISTLSRLVRQAARSDFSTDASPQHHHQQQQLFHAATADDAEEEDASQALATYVRQQSLASIALYILVQAEELLTLLAPDEEEIVAGSASCTISALPHRDAKVDAQRQADFFNASPKKAVEKMVELRAEEWAPPGSDGFAPAYDHAQLPAPANDDVARKVQRVAHFLLTNPALHPEAVAEYLTTPAVFPLQVCVAYLAACDLAGLSVVDALQRFLMAVPLPKEGQRIERLLEYFCSAYYTANHVGGVSQHVFPFANEDACFVVVVALVMLNTDLHNPRAGSRMNEESFRAQMRGCNADQDFPPGFVDELFHHIRCHPLSDRSRGGGGGGDGTTTPSSSSGAVAPPPTSDTRSSFDALFISEEERRHIAFGLEQQRRITSVADALATQPILRDPLDCQPLADWSFCRAAACDLFLATWSSVCAVFGPAVYEDGTSNNNNNSVGQDEVLLRCIRGLQALLCVAASFALSVEAEVTMLALLRMAEYASVRRVCHNAVLAVCSTIHSMHLSARCWLDVFGIMVELRTKQAQSSGEHVERVLARIEAFNRLASDEVVGEVAPSLLTPASTTLMMPTNATTTTSSSSSSSAVASLATIALERLYEGAMDWLCSAAHKDGLSVSAGTSYLRRALEYTLITHPTKHNRSRAARHTAEMKVDVVTMINVRGFSRVIMPRLVELVGAHQHSDEALDLIIRFVVDLLHVMWSSYASRKVALRRTPPQFDAAQQQQQEDDDDDDVVVAAVNPSTFMIDSAPPEFVDCYDFFGICFSQHSKSALVRAHLLQGVKELMSRTLLLAEQSSSSITQPQQLEQHACLGSQSLALYTMISAWRRLLVPIASALAESEASETMSLAVLVLRHLVVGSHPSNHSATRSATHLPREVRGAVLMLLANLAYLGGMCADGDAAQACLGQLSSICSISLTMENVVGASTSASTSCQVVRDDSIYSGPASPTSMTEAVSTSTEAMGYPRSQPDKLVHRLMDQLHVNEHVASQHAVERLVRLLRADQAEIRVEALEHCRSLSLQMQPAQVRHIALQVMHVVLEAAVELPQPTNEVPLSDPSLLAFGVFWVDIPSTLRRCSRAAFRQSLNAVLSFATRDLITAAPANMACTLATLMVERCLTPMLVSPNILSASSAPIAAAAVLQCASLAMPRCTSAERGQLMDVVRHAVGLTLWLRKMPMERAAVPAEANFPGRAYLFSDTNNNNNSNTSTSWQGQAYDHAATEAIHRLGTLTPAEIAGAGVSLRIHGGDSSERSSAAPTPVPTSTTTASATISSRVRGARSGAAGGDALLVADEQLSEYINLLVSLLTALPKLIQQAVSDDDDGVEMHHTHTAHDDDHDHDDGMWKAPAIAASDLLRLLLDAAAALFAVLWRVRHPQQMEAFVAQRFTRDGAGASAGRNTNNNNNNTSSSSLVPHAAIRGVLNSYLELALMADSYPVEHIVPIMLCILDVLREMQASLPSNTSNNSSPLSSSTPKTHKSVYEASTALERAALQRLSPQEQQHIRGCAVGMYQELSVVLGQWVSKIVVMERKGGERVCALRPLLLQPPVFRSVVELLTPLSGPIISVARDYLNAYIGEEESNKNSVIDA